MIDKMIEGVFWLFSAPPGPGCITIPLFIIGAIIAYIDDREREKKGQE